MNPELCQETMHWSARASVRYAKIIKLEAF